MTCRYISVSVDLICHASKRRLSRLGCASLPLSLFRFGWFEMLKHVFCGTVVQFSKTKSLQILKDAVLGVGGDGKIAFVDDASNVSELKSRYGFTDSVVTKLSQHQFLLPGLIDCHAHAPQYCNCGLGTDRELLQWLTTYTFGRCAAVCGVVCSVRVFVFV